MFLPEEFNGKWLVDLTIENKGKSTIRRRLHPPASAALLDWMVKS
jgi:hypothetical protein